MRMNEFEVSALSGNKGIVSLEGEFLLADWTGPHYGCFGGASIFGKKSLVGSNTIESTQAAHSLSLLYTRLTSVSCAFKMSAAYALRGQSRLVGGLLRTPVSQISRQWVCRRCASTVALQTYSASLKSPSIQWSLDRRWQQKRGAAGAAAAMYEAPVHPELRIEC